MSRTQSLLIALFGFVFLSVGIWIGKSKYLDPLAEMRASQKWKDAVCTVISSSENYTPPDEDVGARFGINLQYEFIVGGQTYRSERYNFKKNELESGGEMRQLVGTFSQGAKCLVFYNPLDPRQSVIERRVHTRAVDWIMALVFSLIGGAVLLNSIWQLLKR